jgi:CubicO group peptidase (beta-lactamase class C family)
MKDTTFYVTDQAKWPLIAQPLPDDRSTGPVTGLTDPTVQRRWQAGGAGMVSTIGDYARLAQMLLNGGTLDGKRYLKSETVALMTTDHIGPGTNIAHDGFYFPGGDSGFGFGFAVRTAPPPPPNSSFPIGEYRWDGVGGTFFFIDPKDDMFEICMMQSPSQRWRIENDTKVLVYNARETGSGLAHNLAH